jgi:cell filamentation protein
MSDRYDTNSNVEGQYQPGSNESVLKNKLGIVDPAEINQVELELLNDLTLGLLDEIEVDQQLEISDLCIWHRRWMGTLYDWAGEYRTVNMSKDGFPFAASHLIPALMMTFNDKFLTSLTPCNSVSDDELIEALAAVHVEFILIHPFREGNGRLARLLATVMALQAGKPLLDFSTLNENKDAYVAAIQAGMDDVEPMKDLFKQVLLESL